MRAIRFAGCLTVVMVFGGALSTSPVRGQVMPEQVHAKALLSTNLTLDVNGRTTTLTVAELKALPQKTITVHNAHTKMDETYTGVALDELLAKHGAALDKTNQKRLLHSYVRVEGTDHYFVLYSVGEIEGDIHNGDVIVATRMDGKGLGEDGELKLVASGDKKPIRWVRNMTKLTLMSVD